MWINRPMPVTTRIIIPESGSSLNAQGTSNDPIPCAVASGIGGIQWPRLTTWSLASGGRPSICQNAYSDTPSAPVIAAHATNPDVRLLNERMPTSPLIAAPMPGRIGISQINSIDCSALCSLLSALARLPSHQIHFVDVDRFLVPVERQDDAQADGGLGGRDGDDEYREHLADAVLQLIRKRHQIDVDGVQNQLDRHEDDDDVAAQHDAGDADHEQRRRQQHVMGWCNHNSRFAKIIAPTIATSSSIDATSNGIR